MFLYEIVWSKRSWRISFWHHCFWPHRPQTHVLFLADIKITMKCEWFTLSGKSRDQVRTPTLQTDAEANKKFGSSDMPSAHSPWGSNHCGFYYQNVQHSQTQPSVMLSFLLRWLHPFMTLNISSLVHNWWPKRLLPANLFVWRLSAACECHFFLWFILITPCAHSLGGFNSFNPYFCTIDFTFSQAKKRIMLGHLQKALPF